MVMLHAGGVGQFMDHRKFLELISRAFVGFQILADGWEIVVYFSRGMQLIPGLAGVIIL